MENQFQTGPGFVPPSIPGGFQPTPPGNSARWFLAILGVLIVLGLIGGFFYFRFTRSTNPRDSFEYDSYSQTNSSNGTSSQTNSFGGALNSKACESINESYFRTYMAMVGMETENVKWVLSNEYPSGFPSDFPVYSNSKVLAYLSITNPDNPNSKGYIILTCSEDGIDKVKSHYGSITLASTGWQSPREAMIQTSVGIPADMLEQMLQGLEALPQTFIKGGISKEKIDPKNVISVGIDGHNSGTLITYIWGTGKYKAY